MRRSILLLPFVLAAALLAGCGNKGPLVLPATKPTPAPAPHAVAPITPAAASSSAAAATSQP